MPELTEEQQRVRDYLRTQAAKQPPVQVLERVKAAHRDLVEAATAVPDDRLFGQPAAGEWSANEVLAHVVGYGAYVCEAISCIVKGQPVPELPPDAIPLDPPRRPAIEWIQELNVSRAPFYDRIAQTPPDVYPDITAAHPVFGPLTWREWLLFLRVHDIDHTKQLRQIIEAARA